MRKIPKKGILTIAFDDSYLDTYNHAIKYLGTLNIKTTVAVPSALIGKKIKNYPLMGLKQLKSLIQSGHEVASHGLTHNDLLQLSSKDRKLCVFEIDQSRKELNNLLNYKVTSFVFPFLNRNQANSIGIEMKSYYNSARTTSVYPCYNKIPIDDSYSITGFIVTHKHTPYDLNKQVDIAKEKGLWLIEVFHLIDKNACITNPYKYFMRIADFKKHINYILSKNIAILTQGEVVERYASSF